ncbi:MAG: DUF1569 domain-containing protein [Bacteroidota bacterium]
MRTEILNFLQYVDKLNEDMKPLWGKMTPQHMVEHLILAVRISNGKLKIECFNPPEKIPTLKRFLMSSRPYPKEFINPVIGPDLLPLEYKNLPEAISNLKLEINDYILYFENNPQAVLTNPTFGDLNRDEWIVFHNKHFTHHLQQFGLI